jgi:hypothetical protein
MKRVPLFILLLIFVASCTNQPAGSDKPKNSLTFSNDMEYASTKVPGWVNETTVNEGLAHSGKFSVRMDSTREFSYGFQQILGNLNKNVPNKIIVRAWVYSGVPDPDASCVVQILEGDKSVWWDSAGLKSRMPKANQWTDITFTFKIDKEVFPTSQVRIYIWNQYKYKFYIDDMDITFEYPD